MYINGSLNAALQGYLGNAVQIALLVIDEENQAAPGETSNTKGQAIANSNITAFQQRLLMYMQRMGCNVRSIRFLQGFPGTNDGPDNTRTALSALYNGNQHLLRKPHPNAFRETTLHYDLQRLGITHLVVMGWHANACVGATVGFPWWLTGTEEDGGTHLGYTVMTCNQVLHGGPANWSNATPQHYANLEFYSQF
ncbi:MAG: isochorismatase family protein [Sedimenticola sp.]